MKKFLCCLLVLCLALAFLASCEDKKETENAEQVVNTALEKNRSLKSYEAELKLEIQMFMQGLSVEMPITMNMKAKNVGDDDEVSSAEIGMFLFGANMSMNMYMENGWLYSDDGTVKYKKIISGDAESVDRFCDQLIENVPSEFFGEKTLKTNKDGTKSISLVLPIDKLKGISDGMFGEFYNELLLPILGADASTDSFENAVEVTYTVGKNGYLASMDMKIDLDTELPLDNTDFTADTNVVLLISINYSNINGDVTPTPPKGYLNFKEHVENEPSGDNVGGNEGPSFSDPDFPPTVIPNDTVPDDLSFKGETVTFFTRNDNELWKNEMDTDSTLMHTLYDAVYYRNKTVESELGVKIEQISQAGDYANSKNWNSTLRNSVLTKSEDFDVAAVCASTGSPLAVEGMYQNVFDVPYINLEMPWWNKSVTEGTELFYTSYFLGGDITCTQMLNSVGVFYNKDVFKSLYGNAGYDIHKTVKNGEWTLDYMYILAAGAWCDDDSSGVLSKGDMIGFMPTSNSNNDWRMDAWLPALGVSTVDMVDGYPELGFYNEHTVEAFEKLQQLYNNCPGTLESDGTVTKFVRGEQLFYMDSVLTGASLLMTDCDFEILPMPKYDSSQSEYHTTFSGQSTLLAIPATCNKQEAVGATLELMASESYTLVRPACYDFCFGKDYYEGDNNVRMFNTVIDGAVFDFGFCFSQQSLNNITSLFRDVNADITVKYESNKDKYRMKLEELTDRLDEISFLMN
ncbi:MAG: hypothetical protein IJW79_01620 [Clostridia bacterium]|nr:hypothetical protein [Clostridia bacterium]